MSSETPPQAGFRFPTYSMCPHPYHPLLIGMMSPVLRRLKEEINAARRPSLVTGCISKHTATADRACEFSEKAIELLEIADSVTRQSGQCLQLLSNWKTRQGLADYMTIKEQSGSKVLPIPMTSKNDEFDRTIDPFL